MFELNCGCHPGISFKDKYDTHSQSFSANGLAIEQKELINACCQNLLHTKNVQKQAYNKGVKPCSYAPGEKIWLNSK